jgi:hypothetical protein
MNRVALVLGGIVTVTSLVACGGAPPPPPVETPPPPEPTHAEPAPIQASQELGSIDELATNRAFEGLQNQFLDCQKQGMQRVEFLAGDAKFFIRVGADGAAKWAYLEDSTIGDRATEKCMLGVVTGAHWPKPDGGEAEVQKSISFDVGDARPAVPWRSDKVSSVLATESSDAMQCKGKIRGVFKVTVYVEAGEGEHHKKHPHGKVLSVGVAPPNKDGEAKVDCIVDAVKDWKMPSPGGWAAKVTFSL